MRIRLALIFALIMSPCGAVAQTPPAAQEDAPDENGASQVARARAALKQRLENADAGVVQFRNADDAGTDTGAGTGRVQAPPPDKPAQAAASGVCADVDVFNTVAASIGAEPIETINALKELAQVSDAGVRREVLKQLALSYFVVGFFDEAANVASAYQGADGELALVSAFNAPSPAISPCSGLERLVLYAAGKAEINDGELDVLVDLPAALAQPLAERMMLAAARRGDDAVLNALSPITGAQPEMAPSADVLQTLEDARPQFTRAQIASAQIANNETAGSEPPTRETIAHGARDAAARLQALSIANDAARLARIADDPSGFAALADDDVLNKTALAFASIGDERTLKALKLGDHLGADAAGYVMALAALRRGDVESARAFARSVADDPDYAAFCNLVAVWSADEALARAAARTLAAAGDYRPLAEASWRTRDWRGAVDAFSKTDIAADDTRSGLKAVFAAKNTAMRAPPARLSNYKALFAIAPSGDDTGAVRQFISNVSKEIDLLKSGALDG